MVLAVAAASGLRGRRRGALRALHARRGSRLDVAMRFCARTDLGARALAPAVDAGAGLVPLALQRLHPARSRRESSRTRREPPAPRRKSPGRARRGVAVLALVLEAAVSALFAAPLLDAALFPEFVAPLLLHRGR